MTIVLQNNNAEAQTLVNFTSNAYTTNLFNPQGGAVNNTCGGTVTVAENGTTIKLAGGSIAAGASSTCTITSYVKSNSTGQYTVTIPNLKSKLQTTATSFNGSVWYKLLAPLVNATLSSYTIGTNGKTTLTFTFTNNDWNDPVGTPLSVTAGAFVATYPANVFNFSTPAASSNACGSPTLTAAPGGTSLAVSNLTIPASAGGSPGASCTVQVDITATMQGMSSVPSTASAVTSFNAKDTVLAQKNLGVWYSPAKAMKAFAPGEIFAGATSLMTISLKNPYWNPHALTGVAFSDSYPSGLVNSGTFVSNTCGGTVTAISGGSALSLVGGTIPLGNFSGMVDGSCTITIYVTSSVADTYTNDTGVISSAEAGASASGATAELTVWGVAPTGSSAFAKAAIVTGETTTLTITLSNPNGFDISGAYFLSDYSLDGATNGFLNASSPNPQTTCAGGTPSGDAGGASISVDGATIPAHGSCTVTVRVTGVVAGTFYSCDSSGGFTINSSNAVDGTGTRAQLDITAPEFRIVKAVTSFDSPCLAGSCQVTFTLYVDIASGTGYGTSFDVADVLPAELTYGSSSTSSGTISESSGTVTWSFAGSAFGIVPGAAAKTATITATVNTATQITNCASLASSVPLSDPYPADSCVTFQASAVSLTDFRAEIGSNGTVAVWETGLEAGTIGFYLFRKDEALKGYVPIGTTPVPGLIDSPSGGKYRLGDPGAPRGVPLTYVLVEQQANGQRIAYGPFLVEPFLEGSIDAATLAATALTRVGQVGADVSGVLACFFDRAGNLIPTGCRGKVGKTHSAPAGDVDRIPHGVSPARAERLAISEKELAPETDGSSLTAAMPLATLAGAAPTGKLAVKSAGLKYVSAAQLVTLLGTPTYAVDKQLKKGKLVLSYMGNPVSWFASGNGIYFYGEAGETAFSNDRVYLASWGDGDTMNGDVTGVRQGLVVDPTATFQASLHAEKDLVVNLGNPDPAADYWHWDYVLAYGGSATKSFGVLTPGVRGAGTASMKLKLYGATNFDGVVGDHRVEVRVNGTLVGSGVWEGFNWYDLDVSFNASLLRDGASNSVDLTALVGPDIPFNLVYLDSIDVTYPRNYQAVANSLVYTASANDVRAGGLTVTGFTTSDIVVLNIATPSKPVIVTGAQVAGASGAYRVTFPPAAAGIPYLVTTLAAATAPDSIQTLTGTTLKTTANSADYVIITAPGMDTPAASLAALRASHGWAPKIVLVSEIMDAFGSGNYNPAAIRDFLSYASTKWTKGPKAVVLAGDASYDYRDNLKYGGNLVPTMIVATPFGLASSDNALVDFNGDGAPDIAIGRLAVLNATEFKTVVDKLTAYDAATKGAWDTKVIFSADTVAVGGVSNFSRDSDALVTLKPAADPLDKVYLDSLTLTAARTRLKTDLTSGAGFLNFYGHSTLTKFAPAGLLLSQDVPLIQVGSQTPIVTAGTCFTNRFFDPTVDTIGETLSIQGGGYGAVAVFSSAGYSLTYQATTLLQNFYRSIWQKTASTVGDAALIALRDFRKAGGALFMTRTYTLLGDPATPVRYGK